MQCNELKFPSGTIGKFNEHGQRHCDDGPAIVFADGSEYYMINDEFHRVDGPAKFDVATGYVGWFFHGIQHDFDMWCLLTDKTDEEKTLLKLKYF